MPPTSAPPALALLCETAALALRSAVSAAPPRGTGWRAEPGAAAAPAPGGAGLRVERPLGTDEERALAASFARLAGAVAREEGGALYRRLVEHTHDLIVMVDEAGTALFGSPSVRRVLGYPPEGLIGQSLFPLVHPDDLPRVRAWLTGLAADPGRTSAVEYRFLHADGRWVHLEAVSTAEPDYVPGTGHVINIRDTTRRREAEEELRRSEERFRTLVESAQDMITVVDGGGVIRFQSPAVRRILGFEPEEMVGADAFGLVHPDDVPAVQERFQEVFTTPGTAVRLHFRFRRKDGSWCHVESFARTVLPDSADAGALGVVRDDTERVEAAAALLRAKAEAEAAREEAERANRAKSEFLSRMSHELRTPLNSILGFAQVLEDVALPDEYQAGVRYILKGGRHLLGLINEVLDIARIEAGQQPMSLEPVRAGPVVREAIDMVRPLAAARGIEVAEAPEPGGRAWVHADRQRLAQVLLNLLSNAVKYNRPGGRVRVGTRVEEGGRVRIRVEDQGPGIPPERRGQLFVPFERLGAEHSGVEGTGLGLALSQRLARGMGGELALEGSGPGGSVFYVELQPAADPLADAAGMVASAGGAGGAPRVPRATLLYVEDNLANLTLVETILLPRPGWRVLPALQGRIGLELAAEHLPDVVLLDLHLPDLPGREVLRQLRADPRTAAVPVVVVTADSTPRTAESLLADGADAFLTKPLDVREFLATVERVLEGKCGSA